MQNLICLQILVILILTFDPVQKFTCMDVLKCLNLIKFCNLKFLSFCLLLFFWGEGWGVGTQFHQPPPDEYFTYM